MIVATRAEFGKGYAGVAFEGTNRIRRVVRIRQDRGVDRHAERQRVDVTLVHQMARDIAGVRHVQGHLPGQLLLHAQAPRPDCRDSSFRIDRANADRKARPARHELRAALIAKREVSATEVVDAHLQRIDAVNHHVNAVVVVLADQAREAAGLADRALVQQFSRIQQVCPFWEVLLERHQHAQEPPDRQADRGGSGRSGCRGCDGRVGR